MTRSAQVVILGTGMAGLAAAYHLAVKHQIKHVVIVDERAPLGLTSSRGTMAYRNWFPGPGDAMVRLMNRSIDLLQEIDAESNHAIRLTQNGYVYFTTRAEQIEKWRHAAQDAEQRGVGALREHRDAQNYALSPGGDWRGAPDGVDLITNPDLIRQFYPCITDDVAAMLHIRRAGAFDVFALGNWLLERAQAHGARFLRDRVERITTRGGRVETIHLASGEDISTRTFVIAAGPLLANVARWLEIELPVYNELHGKITLRDTEHVFPRYGDLILWDDPQRLEWSEGERAELFGAEETRWLLDEFPGGVHFLPKGTDDDPHIMALWTYDIHPTPFVDPPAFEPHYAEIVLRGLARMIPRARVYFGRGREAIVDGGYYCKTRENRPLIGPLPVEGAYVCGALSGFGVMASQGAAELVSAHVTGSALPEHARWFFLSRYADSAYQSLLKDWDSRAGQL